MAMTRRKVPATIRNHPPNRAEGFPAKPKALLKIVLVEQSSVRALVAACRTLPDIADPLLEKELLGFARRARTASRGEAAMIVREAMLITGRWARAIDAVCWREREERAARLLQDGICGRAAVTLLPQGVTYEVETLSPLHDWARITVAELGFQTEATAHSVAAALIAAQFQAIAQAFRETAPLREIERSDSA